MIMEQRELTNGRSDEEKYGDVVYVGTEVYQQPTAQCPAPCIMVFPPSTLDSPTAITLEPYTATLEVGSTTTTIVAVPTPRTTTVTVVNFFNYYVTSNLQPGAPLTLLPSFQAPPVPVVVTGPDGQTTTRTVVPPPNGDPGSSGGNGTSTGNPDEPQTDWPFMPPPTATPEPTQGDDDESDNHPPFTLPGLSDLPGAPVPTRWPSTGSIKPVTDINLPKPPGGVRVSCRAWFFLVCIDWGNSLKVDFWDIELPPGGIGPYVSFGPP
jgi:chitinase